MGWLQIVLSDEQQKVVNFERNYHDDLRVRTKMLVLWALHCGLTREQAARIGGVGRATAQRYVAAFRDGGLDGLRRFGWAGPVSEMADHAQLIKQSLTQAPVRTVAQACDRIEELTGLRRGPTQVRVFLARLGFKWQRTRAVPVPPKKTLAEHVADQREFLDNQLKPKLDAAVAGNGQVLFVDAAHFVFGTFLCCLWSIARVYVRAASGRQRFNVLGAWNAVTRELITVTNTSVVNSQTMCELLREVAARKLAGPVTLVPDNARYQRNKRVMALAAQLKINLLFLPSYSPNLNLIERLWRFTRRRACYGRYHPNFAAMTQSVRSVLEQTSTTHAEALKSLMTLKFQQFDDVSLLAA